MPIPDRTPFKLTLRGINLVDLVDQLPPGDYPYCNNIRSLSQDGVESRPGQDPVFPAAMPDLAVHSIRSLTDITSPAPLYELLIGAGTNLYGQLGAAQPVLIDSGYSGNPLSLVPYRPDQSPDPRMYVANDLRMSRINTTTGVRDNVGIAPPNVPPSAEVTSNLHAVISSDVAASWSATGIAGSITSQTRVSTNIAQILYDTGTTGFATISPASTDNHWLQPGARLVLAGGPDTSTVLEVHPAISSTTIDNIVYDSGATGDCTMVLVGLSKGIARNSLIVIAGEVIRVLSVTPSPDGSYSLRCSTVGSYAAGNAVTGLVSFRMVTSVNYAIGTTLTALAVQFILTTGATFVGGIKMPRVVDLSSIRPGIPLQLDDYIHISINANTPSNITSGRLLLDVDSTLNDFTKEYYQYEFTSTAFTDAGSSQWVELFVRVSDFTKIGSDYTRTFANVQEIGVELTVTGNTTVQIAAWWAGGGYGPDVIPGSPVGLIYRYRYRDSRTGAKSVPGAATRYELFPQRQQVTVLVYPSTDTQVDSIDIERLDPLLQAPAPATASFTYVGTVPNALTLFNDNLSATAISSNPSLETNVFQPFPVLKPPLAGVVNVVGTWVTYVSGDLFPANLIAGTVILINGVAYQTYGQPLASNVLQLVLSAGTQLGVSYSIVSPVIAGTPLPVLFGPLEGPTASFLFGTGDSDNPGTIYYTNGNDPDSAASTNFIEITPPSEPQIGGVVWNTYVFSGSRERLFMVQPTFDQPNLFTPLQIPAASGFWSPWSIAAGKDGIYYLGRDGIYRAVPYSGSIPVATDLWPLFPHEGDPGVQAGPLLPVDMTQGSPSSLQHSLTVCEQDVYLDYLDTGGARRTLRYAPDNIGASQPRHGWLPSTYAHPVTRHYWEEVPFGTTPRLLECTSDGFVMASRGDADVATNITCSLQLPIINAGDSRAQKLYMDCITDMDGVADITLGFNYNSILLGAVVTSASPRGQGITIIDSVLLSGATVVINLPIFINISALYTFHPGTTLYEFQPSFYPQPYIVENVVTQFKDHGMPGWKVTRFGRFAYISATPLTLTIATSDERAYEYTLPAHLGHLHVYDFNVQQLQKGELFAYDLRSGDCQPFVLFPDETYIKMKPWTGDGPFSEVKPFIT